MSDPQLDVVAAPLPPAPQFDGINQPNDGLLCFELLDSKNPIVEQVNQRSSLPYDQIAFIWDGDIWFINTDGLNLT